MTRAATRCLPLCAVVALFVTSSACASLASDVNALRFRGCTGHAGSPTKLRASADLDKVARQWSRGGRLRDALDRTGYRVTDSASMHIGGTRDDATIVRALGQYYCEQITRHTFSVLGIYRRADDVWLVVATPFSPPTLQDAPQVDSRVLALINAARAKPRKCGSQSFPAVGPLRLSALLTQAALAQAQDMAAHEHFEHIGTDGSSPADRVTRTGYKWLNVAENIAAGASTADDVVNGWLESPGHCANIMGAPYTEMGIAYVVDARTKAGIYWSQVFGKPR